MKRLHRKPQFSGLRDKAASEEAHPGSSNQSSHPKTGPALDSSPEYPPMKVRKENPESSKPGDGEAEIPPGHSSGEMDSGTPESNAARDSGKPLMEILEEVGFTRYPDLRRAINESFPDSGEHELLQPEEAAQHPLYGQKFTLYPGAPIAKPVQGWRLDEKSDFLRSAWDHQMFWCHRLNPEKYGKVYRDWFEKSREARMLWEQHVENPDLYLANGRQAFPFFPSLRDSPSPKRDGSMPPPNPESPASAPPQRPKAPSPPPQSPGIYYQLQRSPAPSPPPQPSDSENVLDGSALSSKLAQLQAERSEGPPPSPLSSNSGALDMLDYRSPSPVEDENTDPIDCDDYPEEPEPASATNASGTRVMYPRVSIASLLQTPPGGSGKGKGKGREGVRD